MYLSDGDDEHDHMHTFPDCTQPQLLPTIPSITDVTVECGWSRQLLSVAFLYRRSVVMSDSVFGQAVSLRAFAKIRCVILEAACGSEADAVRDVGKTSERGRTAGKMAVAERIARIW